MHKRTTFDDAEQYPISRDIFAELFKELDTFIGLNMPGYENNDVKLWYYDNEIYIMYKPAMIVVNYYKLGHVGRTNTSSIKLTVDEYKKFVSIVEHSITDDTGYTFTDYYDDI